MATRPTEAPEWASQDQLDGVTGAANKVEPTAAYKLSGMNRGENIVRPYLNYILDLLSDWVTYFDEGLLEGTDTTTGNSIAVTIPDQGGTGYRVLVTPKANLGNVWVVNDSSTQFTINTSSADGAVDWFVINK